MKKKKIKLVLLIIIAIGILFIISSESSKTFVKDGITYAVLENGKKVNQVPSNGAYRVDVTCTNATGKWNYAKWELEVSNLTQNEVKCNLSFTSTSETIAEHIIAHATSGLAQGEGYVVNEIGRIPDYDKADALIKTDYGTITTYVNTTTPYDVSTHSSSSATTLGSIYSYNDTTNEWSTIPSGMTSGSYYYYFQFTTSEAGYYRVCYNLSTGSSNNRLYIYNGSTGININGSSYLSADANNPKNGCQ